MSSRGAASTAPAGFMALAPASQPSHPTDPSRSRSYLGADAVDSCDVKASTSLVDSEPVHLALSATSIDISEHTRNSSASVGVSADSADLASIVTSQSSALKSVQFRQNTSLEAESSLAFIRIVHSAFPRSLVDVVLTSRGPDGNFRVSRTFVRANPRWTAAFDSARDEFIATTLAEPLPLNDAANSAIQWQDEPLTAGGGGWRKAEYTSRAYEELQIDCLAKILVDGDVEWTTEGSPCGKSIAFIASDKQQIVPPSSGRVSCSERPWRRASMTSDGKMSTSSDSHYEPQSTHYVVGEVYFPTSNEHGYMGQQKLLQIERVLQFLKHKEGKSDICDCVAGAILLGPKFNRKSRSHLFRQLDKHQMRFPCLWSLQIHRRLMALEVSNSPTAVIDVYREERISRVAQTARINKLDQTVQQQAAQAAKDRARIDQMVQQQVAQAAEERARIDQMVQQQFAQAVAALQRPPAAVAESTAYRTRTQRWSWG